MQVLGSIDRVDGASLHGDAAEFFDRRDAPVVIEGSIGDWPALTAWTSEGLRARIGSVATSFKQSPSHRHPDFAAPDLATMFAVRSGTFGELLDRLGGAPEVARRFLLTGSEEYFLRRSGDGGLERNVKLAPLLADFEVPDLVPPDALRSSWFWLSSAGVRTWLHYDNNGCHNLNAQVRGAKTARLFAPDQLARLYPFELGGDVPAHNCCRVDVEAPDASRYPEFEHAECLEADLRAGDLLFIPANWVHTFLHTGAFNVNVNFWWRPRRPIESVVSARQAFLDQVAALGDVGTEASAVLADIDRRLIAR